MHLSASANGCLTLDFFSNVDYTSSQRYERESIFAFGVGVYTSNLFLRIVHAHTMCLRVDPILTCRCQQLTYYVVQLGRHLPITLLKNQPSLMTYWVYSRFISSESHTGVLFFDVGSIKFSSVSFSKIHPIWREFELGSKAAIFPVTLLMYLSSLMIYCVNSGFISGELHTALLFFSAETITFSPVGVRK